MIELLFNYHTVVQNMRGGVALFSEIAMVTLRHICCYVSKLEQEAVFY